MQTNMLFLAEQRAFICSYMLDLLILALRLGLDSDVKYVALILVSIDQALKLAAQGLAWTLSLNMWFWHWFQLVWP